MADEPVAQNPLTAGIESGLLPSPCSVVIFGGSGDLARRKLIPALYNTALDGLLRNRLTLRRQLRRIELRFRQIELPGAEPFVGSQNHSRRGEPCRQRQHQPYRDRSAGHA